MDAIRNSESTPTPRRRGRRPRPPRCVIQIRLRADGVIVPIASFTVDCDSSEAMRRVQKAFADVMQTFRRQTDDPRWATGEA